MSYKFSMMRRIFFPLAIVLMVVSGCYKRISPGGGGDDDPGTDPELNPTVHLYLTLVYPTELPQYKDVSYDTKAEGSMSCLLRLYPLEEEGGYAKTPAYEFNEADGAVNGYVFSMDVKPAKYRIAAWTSAQGWYNTADFAEITLAGIEYTACSEERDAFCGLLDLDLSKENGMSGVVVMPMERPHARYNFVATDKEAFAELWSKEMSRRGQEVSKSSVDLSQFHVHYSYPQFLPNTYSLFGRKPVDSATDVEFEAKMTLLEDGTVDLGFDYVFVGDDESSIVVTLSFFDQNGEFISSLSDLEIPLVRGKNTTVKGKLLTSGISNGITINPGFDGEIVITI